MLTVNQFIGFGARVAAPVVSTIVQQASAFNAGGSANFPITWPSVQAGDIAVLLESIQGISTPPASAVPSGFTQIGTSTVGGGADCRMTSSAKICTGAEAGNLSGFTSGTFNLVSRVLCTFRPNLAASAISIQDVENVASDGNPSAQTISAAAGVAPLIVLGFYGSTTAINPRTFTVGGVGAKDGEVQCTTGDASGAGDLWIAWKIYNSSPADVVVDMDDEGDDNTLHSCYVQVS